MRIRIEPRRAPSPVVAALVPVVAVICTIIATTLLLDLLGYDMAEGFRAFFLTPFLSTDGWAELGVKAAPLILIGLGLTFTFRMGLTNVGAEGQLIMGAMTGGWVALASIEKNGPWVLPAICLAGAGGGLLWAIIPALLKIRWEVNEILSSLMLTYVGQLCLAALIYGPWRDPAGMNFPQSRLFSPVETLPILVSGTRLHLGVLIALLTVPIGWLISSYSVLGYRLRLAGMAPKAARLAGCNRSALILISFMISGGLAGLAGSFEITGPIGQIIPDISPGYGFTAIIVAFIARLNPLAIIPAGMFVAQSYLGGEAAQIALGVPKALTNLVQGTLLFFLLGFDIATRFRIRRPSVLAVSDRAAS